MWRCTSAHVQADKENREGAGKQEKVELVALDCLHEVGRVKQIIRRR